MNIDPWSCLAALVLCTSNVPAQSKDWQQPDIRTGTDAVEALPWVSTIEAALARAAKEKKLVLATVVAVSDDHWVAGYAGATDVWKSLGEPVFGTEVGIAIDAGLRKERVMMAAWFTDPDVVALVQKHFVLVRVRARPWDFDLDMPTDPLAPLGTKLDDVGAPALVVAKSNGTFVHALGHIGVFAPSIAAATMRQALAKAGIQGVATPSNAPRKEMPSDVIEFAEKFGVHLDEWTKGALIQFDSAARTTEIDATKQPIDTVLGRAADALLALQAKDGGWRDPATDVRAIGGVGTRYDLEVARTGLVVDALLSLRARLPQRKAEFENAARRGIAIVGKFADAPQPWVWQATYALHLQLALLRCDLDDEKPKARERAQRLIATLVGMQQDGGWSYMPAPRTHSFNTAPVLLLLSEARALGLDVPKSSIEKAIAFLASLRNPNDERDYWYAPAMKFEPRASSCRSALCEQALVAAGDKDALRRLEPAVLFFFDDEPAARSVTKIYESYLSPKALQDAYHYYFGHYYVARALARLSKDKAAKLAQHQVSVLKAQVEADGSFVDAQAQGKSYSTAMAVLTLLEDLRWTKP